MRHILLFLILLVTGVTAAPRASTPLHGTWRSRVSTNHTLQLNLARENDNWGHDVELSELTGLTDAQIRSSGSTPVHFSLTRGAGTIAFEGTFSDGEGAGHFSFTPNASYAAELRTLGVASSELQDEDLFSLAILDVSTQFIRDMQAAGYHGPLEDFKRFRIHGATPQFVRDIKALGYSDLSAEDLIRFRIHGVTPDFVRAMNELGYHPSTEDVIRFQIHGVRPDFVKALNSLGYRNLSSEDLIRFQIHGVTSEFVRELKGLGYTPDAEDLVRMQIHGVTIEFIRSLQAAGYSGIPVEKLIEMKIHGLDARSLKAASM